MGQLELHQEDFDISIVLNGSKKIIKVKPEDTTDGAAYFRCIYQDKDITQIREDENGTWEQIWGDLDQREVDAIGKAIAALKK